MENNITLLPLDGFSMPQKETCLDENHGGDQATLDLPAPRFTESQINEKTEIKASDATKDERSRKEKMIAAIAREREVFAENKVYNKEAAKKWADCRYQKLG